MSASNEKFVGDIWLWRWVVSCVCVWGDTFPDIGHEESLNPGSNSLLHNWDLLWKNVREVVLYPSAQQAGVRGKAQGLREATGVAQTEQGGPGARCLISA